MRREENPDRIWINFANRRHTQQANVGYDLSRVGSVELAGANVAIFH